MTPLAWLFLILAIIMLVVGAIAFDELYDERTGAPRATARRQRRARRMLRKSLLNRRGRS